MEQLTPPISEMNLPQVTFTQKKQQRLEANWYAKPEPGTQRIIDKLKMRLQRLDEQVTEDRLKDSRSKIQYWINRHIAHRIPLDVEKTSLFSEGRNPAKMSKRIEELRESLRDGFNLSLSQSLNLKGRISKTS